VFDLDGVLVDSEAAVRSSVDAALYGTHERHVTDEKIRLFIE
jgi:phosphoglycolate phosphatase-like HAD superfamily hydrolase